MTDPQLRGAARTATLGALPIALLVGAGAFALLRPSDDRPPAAAAIASTTAPPVPRAPVAMTAPRLTGRPAALCRTLLADLPKRVRDLPRRAVTAGPEQNAAYGEPPLTVACGEGPATFPATTQLLKLDGVCWYGRPSGAGTVWTTVDREVPVTVSVPPPVEGAGQRVIDFSAPTVGAIPAHPSPPSGCRDDTPLPPR